MQDRLNAVLNALKTTIQKILNLQIKDKRLFDNAKIFYDGREMIISAFKNKTFPFHYEESRFEDEDENEIRDENELINRKELDRLIYLRERG